MKIYIRARIANPRQRGRDRGLNRWWGSEVRYGRNQWSFFTSERPFEIISWDIRNINCDLRNNCVPVSFAEGNAFFGGNTPYEDIIRSTGYIDGVGVRHRNNPNIYRGIVSEHFDNSSLGIGALRDLGTVLDIKNSGGLIHVNMPHRGMRHADNLRSIRFYHSGKVTMRLRIGSFRLPSNDNRDWWFYLLRGVR